MILNSWAVETNVIEWIAHIIKICSKWEAERPKIKLLIDPTSMKTHSWLEMTQRERECGPHVSSLHTGMLHSHDLFTPNGPHAIQMGI